MTADNETNIDQMPEEQLQESKHARVGGIAAEQLNSIIQRIERLHEEQAGLREDIAQIYAEAKGNGFDVKTIRTIIRLRRLDAAERDEADHLLYTYMKALGMSVNLAEEEETA